MVTHPLANYAHFPPWQSQDSGQEGQDGSCKASSRSRLRNLTPLLLPHSVAQRKSQRQPRINRVKNRLRPLMRITAKNLWPYLVYHRAKEKSWGEFCNVVSLWYEALHGKHCTRLRNVTEKSQEPKQTFHIQELGSFKRCSGLIS